MASSHPWKCNTLWVNKMLVSGYTLSSDRDDDTGSVHASLNVKKKENTCFCALYDI